MDTQSIESNFLLSGGGLTVSGAYSWNDDDTELTFVPERSLLRSTDYTLKIGTGAKSQSGMALDEYNAALRTYDNLEVSLTEVNYGSITFAFTAPLTPGNYDELVTVSPAVDNLDVNADGSYLYVYGNFDPDTDYQIQVSEQVSDQWGQSLEAPYILDAHTPALPPSLY